MSGRIRLLSDVLISQIAAGEVVERPASVVKELIENSLDAGCHKLQTELEQGGRALIRVSDDGSGMGVDDAVAAFDRHATSKIASFDDLAVVETMGFRGEALAALAAVAKVELVTALESQPGTRVVIEGGAVRAVGRAERAVAPAARPRGTTVTASALFFNVPARRRFLRGVPVELRRCLEVVSGYALARPEVQFTVSHDQRELLFLPPVPDEPRGLLQRIGQLFSDQLRAHLVPIEGGAWVSGFVGDRTTLRSRRQFTFVNRRLVRDRALLSIFYRVVRETWHGDDFPALFLFLEVPPGEVDVNVHPQKTEVRLRDPERMAALAAVLRRSVEAARGAEPIGPSGRAFSGSVPGLPRSSLGETAGEPHSALPPGAHHAPDGALAAGEIHEGEGAGGPWAAERAPRAGTAALPFSPRADPRLRVVGQYKGAVVVAEGEDGLYLLDQHAAHERVLYERLRRSLEAAAPAVQALLEPRVLELAPAEAIALGELAAQLLTCGFELEGLSGRSVLLRATPAALSPDEAERLLLGLAAEHARERSDLPARDLRRRLLEQLAADSACGRAVRFHQSLPLPALERLVEELFAAEQPFSCPHGRPTLLRFGDEELLRRFGRVGWRAGGTDGPEGTGEWPA